MCYFIVEESIKDCIRLNPRLSILSFSFLWPLPAPGNDGAACLPDKLSSPLESTDTRRFTWETRYSEPRKYPHYYNDNKKIIFVVTFTQPGSQVLARRAGIDRTFSSWDVLSSQASRSRCWALLTSPRLYAAWMPSVLGLCTMGSPPGMESLLPMSPAPGWTEAHTRHHLHRQCCLWEPPARRAGCALAREGCSEMLPLSRSTANFSTCPLWRHFLHGARGEGGGRGEAGRFWSETMPGERVQVPQGSCLAVWPHQHHHQLPHCYVPQRDTVSRGGRKASQNLSMWKSRPSLPGKCHKGHGI